MKIAVSSVEANISSKVESRFGRAGQFMIYDSDSKEWKVMPNALQMDLPQGAGIQTAQNLIREGVNAVITGHCGPNAHRVLTGGGVSIYCVGARTVKEAVDELLSGSLKASGSADVEGHWV